MGHGGVLHHRDAVRLKTNRGQGIVKAAVLSSVHKVSDFTSNLICGVSFLQQFEVDEPL